jgi:hypothetical protein
MAISTISQAGLDAPITLTSPVINTPTMGGSVITSGTAQASTSGTSIDFTSIPSWVKRITVMLNGVSTNGTSNILFQLGSGSVTTTGYVSTYMYVTGTSASAVSSTSGFHMAVPSNTCVFAGAVTFSLVSSNTWVGSGTVTLLSTAACSVSGLIALGGALDRVRITTVNGTDTFDAGSINILYE